MRKTVSRISAIVLAACVGLWLPACATSAPQGSAGMMQSNVQISGRCDQSEKVKAEPLLGEPEVPASRRTVRDLPIWKTITLGTYSRTANEFWEALDRSDRKPSSAIYEVMRSPDFKTSEFRQEVNLVVVSVKELGFSGIKSAAEICDRAIIEFGLDLCPNEVGPQLVLQLELGMPENEKLQDLIIASRPLTVLHTGVRHDQCLFGVRYSENGIPILRRELGEKNDKLCLKEGTVLVFVRRP